MGTYDGKCSFCLWEFYFWLCRLWGIVTSIALWGIGVEAAFYKHYVGYVIIVEAVIVTFLEVVFFVDFCVKVFKGDEEEDTLSTCLKCWECVLCLDNWKKGVFYLVLAIGCFIEPHDVWLAIIAGVMLVMSGIFYIVKTCGSMNEDTHIKLPQATTYDRFDDLPEDLEDNILNPIDPGPSVCVADQQGILEL